MKKRKHWSIYSKPRVPVAPSKPEKKLVSIEKIAIDRGSGESVKLNTINLPDGVALGDIEIDITSNEYGDVCWNAFLCKEIEIDNPHYEPLMKEYKKRLEAWRLKKNEYDKELKDWEIWCNLEKEKQLQHELKRAEALLVKHGRLVKQTRKADS